MSQFNRQKYWLKAKFSQRPKIYIVRGQYPIEYEGGYEWTVCYCDTAEQADRTVYMLKSELKAARRALAQWFVPKQKAWQAWNKARFVDGRTDEECKELYDDYRNTSDAFREAVDRVFPAMFDQQIPWPNSQLMERNMHDGPICYDVIEVYKCP